jgi:hypothetical protein
MESRPRECGQEFALAPRHGGVVGSNRTPALVSRLHNPNVGHGLSSDHVASRRAFLFEVACSRTLALLLVCQLQRGDDSLPHRNYAARRKTSGFSLAYSLATAIFGGSTPAISTYLIHITNNRAIPALWLSFAAICGLLGAFLANPYRETKVAWPPAT